MTTSGEWSRRVTELYGRIDVVDYNVGLAHVGLPEEEWGRIFAVNLKGCYLTMKHVIPLMEKQGGGSIINISSVAGIRYTGVPYSVAGGDLRAKRFDMALLSIAVSRFNYILICSTVTNPLRTATSNENQTLLLESGSLIYKYPKLCSY
jgi:NAD(P)-dependent dehydrogenase (short-subunit alcohol dehydrogenase family)